MNRIALGIALTALVAIVAGAGLLVHRLVSADHATALAERQRLALWRLDAHLTGLMMGEASRPPRAYRDGRLVELPPAPWLLHVECHADGRVTSPQGDQGAGVDRLRTVDSRALGSAIPWTLPTSAVTAGTPSAHPGIRMPDQAGSAPVVEDDYQQRARTILSTSQQVQQAQNAVVPVVGSSWPSSARAPSATARARSPGVESAVLPLAAAPSEGASHADQSTLVPSSVSLDPAEAHGRDHPVIIWPVPTMEPADQVPVAISANDAIAHEAESGLATVHWIGPHLALVRAARVDGELVIQAAVFDRASLFAELRQQITDLLPAAELIPVQTPAMMPERADRSLAMAAAPVQLVPGAIDLSLSPAVRGTIGLALLTVLLGLVCAVAVLIALARLSERRAAFVSAVTHELRTPLTALCLHADLLADARIGGDPSRRAERIAILRDETGRLTHLIDNVLDYARLERRPPRVRVLPLSELIEPLLPHLRERLQQAGLVLDHDRLPEATVRCDPAAVERIIRNLVDNAAKYAGGSAESGPPAAVHLRFHVTPGQVELVVRDFGPGIDVDTRRQLFTPFFRSAEAAAGHAPGVGLGLTLCRRLARAQGGDLRVEPASDGPGLVVRVQLVRC